MKVLSHGILFNNDFCALSEYKGEHEIRSFCTPEVAECSGYFSHGYTYDLQNESLCDVLARIDWQPDLILFWYPETLPPPMGVEDSPVRTVALVSDWNLHYPKLKLNLARYDCVLCDKAGLTTLASDMVSPARLFPLYSQSTPIHKLYSVEKDIDVVFVGGPKPSIWPKRAQYLERLAKMGGKYQVSIGESLHGDAYARQLCRSRIVFNHSVRGELNIRTFEALACGSLLFLEEDNVEAGEYFENGRDLVLYNEDNFEVLVAYYLEHPEEAEAIARRGHARAEEFAGENRLDAIIEWGAEQPMGVRRFREFDEFEQLHQSFLMYTCSWLKSCRAIEKTLMERLAQEDAVSPRIWTAVASYLANPHVEEGFKQSIALCCRAAERARQLAPDSVPYAFNAAWAWKKAGELERATECLLHAVDAGSLEGEELMLCEYDSRFWYRWQMALAEKRTSLEMLKAEAHIVLADAWIEREQLDEAEEHLERARQLDEGNYGWVKAMAEIYWQSDRRDEAVEVMFAALSQFPFDVAFRMRLCKMLTELRRFDDAEGLAVETRTIFSACATDQERKIIPPLAVNPFAGSNNKT